MTAPALLAWIAAALLFQVMVGIGLALRRRNRRIAVSIPESSDPPMIAAPSVATGWRALRVVRRQFENEAETQCSFYLEASDGQPLPPFRAGQFLTIGLEIQDESGLRIVTRCYSLSDCPSQQGYRLTIKRLLAPASCPGVPPGVASGHMHDRVHVGDVLWAREPAGRFCIDTTSTMPVVLIAGGIGITPLISMLGGLLAEQPGRAVHFFYGVTCGPERVLKKQLAAIAAAHAAISLHIVYSRPEVADVLGRDFHHAGHIDLELLKKTLPPALYQFYICGPAAMMQTVLPALAAWGVSADRVHYEAFGPATRRGSPAIEATAPAADAVGLAVHFRRSGRTVMWTGEDRNLLEFAERHAIAVASGCRTGSCGSCEVQLLSGRVGYGELPDHELSPSACLLCVGIPKSALELEA